MTSQSAQLTIEILQHAGVFQSDISRENDEAEVHGQDDDRYFYVEISFREYLAACAITSMVRTPSAWILAHRTALRMWPGSRSASWWSVGWMQMDDAGRRQTA